MGCAISMVKYLLFIFNFVIVLLGIAILSIGVWIHLEINDYDKITAVVNAPVIALIIIGVIIFVIAFFGCCGAVRENHCMVVTYAVFLLTILIVQIAIGIWAFVISKDVEGVSSTTLTDEYRKNIFNNYWTDQTDRDVVDTLQSGLKCCGVTSSGDFNQIVPQNSTIPWSCCGNDQNKSCTSNIYSEGCATKLIQYLNKFAKVVGGVLIGVGATELVGIIFALCLANSIRNDDRRGYRV